MKSLFEQEDICYCRRCGFKCKVDPIKDSKATMLKRSKEPKGLCINCAAHDCLRNLYPANLILARSGPKGLALPHIQQQFESILKLAGTDSEPGEINWSAVIANWDLPFPHKIKRTSVNPMNEEDMAREIKLDKKRMEMLREEMADAQTPLQRLEARKKKAADFFKAKVIPLLRSESNNENS